MLNRRKMRRIFENFPLSRSMIQEYLLYIVHPTRVSSRFKMEKITIFHNTIESLDGIGNEASSFATLKSLQTAQAL